MIAPDTIYNVSVIFSESRTESSYLDTSADCVASRSGVCCSLGLDSYDTNSWIILAAVMFSIS